MKCWAFCAPKTAFSKCSTKLISTQTDTSRHTSLGLALFVFFSFIAYVWNVQKISEEKTHHQRQTRGEVYLWDDWRKQRRPNLARRIHQVLHGLENFAINNHFFMKFTTRTSVIIAAHGYSKAFDVSLVMNLCNLLCKWLLRHLG